MEISQEKVDKQKLNVTTAAAGGEPSASKGTAWQTRPEKAEGLRWVVSAQTLVQRFIRYEGATRGQKMRAPSSFILQMMTTSFWCLVQETGDNHGVTGFTRLWKHSVKHASCCSDWIEDT